MSPRRESIKSKRSALDSKRWRTYSSAILSLADWSKWDLTLLTCSRTWYWFKHVISNVGHWFRIPLSRSPMCVPQMLWTKCCFAALRCSSTSLLSTGMGLQRMLCNASRCITYCLRVTCTHKRPSVPHVELQESACCKYRARHVGVTKSMDAVTAGDHWSRCRHRLRLQLPLPLSLIPRCSSRSQWICNDRAGFWIRDEGRQVFKTTERSGSASYAGCRAGFNATRWFCLWGSTGCWCVTTACTQRGGWSNYWPLLCSRQGDICTTRIVQRRLGGDVLTLDCRGYGTPSLRGIPLASWYGNASNSRGKLRMPRRPTLLLILTTSNISYDWWRDRVRALGRYHPIWMFDFQKVGILSSACKCNSRRGRLLSERPWTDSTKKGGAV